MKNYLNLEGLSQFLNNLFKKFSIIGHNHTIADINDLDFYNILESFDDDYGNVTIECDSIKTSISSTIDSDGNVKIVCISESKEYEDELSKYEVKLNEYEVKFGEYEDKLSELEAKVESLTSLTSDVENLTSIINDNDILIANNVSN